MVVNLIFSLRACVMCT